MNTDKILRIGSKSSEQTEQLAASVGKKLRGGEVIELASDLGGGKTTFVRGLARGAGYEGNVASPSYVISREYATSNIVIHHYDFYRLPEAGLMKHELQDVLSDTRNVVVIEWGGSVADILPDKKLKITIQKISDDERKLQVSFPDKLKYLIEDLC